MTAERESTTHLLFGGEQSMAAEVTSATARAPPPLHIDEPVLRVLRERLPEVADARPSRR